MADLMPWEEDAPKRQSAESSPWEEEPPKPKIETARPSIKAPRASVVEKEKPSSFLDNLKTAGAAVASKLLEVLPTAEKGIRAKPLVEGITGVAEPVAAMATGGLTATAGGAAGAARTAGGMLSSGARGVARAMGSQVAPGETPEESMLAGADVQRKVAGAAYSPRTESGQAVTELAAAPFKLAGEGLGKVGGAAGGLIGPKTEAAMSTIGEVLPEAIGARAGVRGLVKAGEAYSMSGALTQEQAAIQRAQSKGFMAAPAKANPGAINQLMESISGGKIGEKLTVKNQQLANDKVREGLGVPKETYLDKDAFDAYRAAKGEKYDAVREYKEPFTPDKKYLEAIDSLDTRFRAIKETFPAAYKQAELEQLRSQLQTPMNPAHPGALTADVVVDISKQLRNDASKTLKSTASSPAEVNAAVAKKEAATALEDLLERHLETVGQEKLVKDFKDARRDIAMSHDIEAATNLTTGNVDPQKLRRLMEQGRPLSGPVRDVAEAAAALPQTVRRAEGITPSAGLSSGDVAQMGVLGKLAKGGKYALLGAGAPIATAIGSSRPYQVMMAQPSGKRVLQLPMAESATASIMLADPEARREERAAEVERRKQLLEKYESSNR